MEKFKRTAKKWLCFSIAIILLGMIISCAVQTDFGKVKIKKLNWETDEGLTMSAYLYVPKGASPENKLPAVVTSHGTYNNKEMQDANFVELARRGFIVLTIDCPLHGDSEVNPAMVLPDDPSKLGIWESVLMLSRLPYVDTDRIGVTGHSRGGENVDYAVRYDNEFGTNLIASALYNCYDATYTDKDTGEFINIFGTRDAAIISCVYDEFFHSSKDANGNKLWSPYFMETSKAQSFLYFGEDPTGLEAREAYTMYHKEIDGEDCLRIIYRPTIIHPWSHFSTRSTSYVIDFFTESLGAPNPISSSNQIWLVKEFANGFSFIGLVIFLICLAITLVNTPAFADLKAEKLAEPLEADKKGMKWFWIPLVLSAVFAGVIYLPVVRWGANMKVSQTESLGLGLWSAFCGLFAIISMIVYYQVYGKKNGFDLKVRGVCIGKKIWKTILLSIILIAFACLWVFFGEYFFTSDFRFWTLAFKTFTPERLFTTLPYLPLFLLFYIPASISANSFNYVKLGKKKWVNLLVVAVFVALPAMLLPWMQYIVYYNTNFPLFGNGYWFYVMYILWLFPILLILLTTTVQSRIIYKATNNPYISGIVAGTIVAIMTCTNTMYVLL